MADLEPVPDSGMETGSEEGESGGTTDTRPLTDEEREILHRLQHAGGPEVVEHAPEEDSVIVGEAAEDDAPVPGYAPARQDPDPLDPVFREPAGE